MRPGSPIGPANGQASLLTAILMLAVLTVVGIALEFTTGAHRAGAATEWAISRAYYAADAGIRWATVELRDPAAFLSRPEFQDPSNPFGAVAVPLPSHDHGSGGLFSGDPQEEGIRVTVQKPGLLGRRPCVTDAEKAVSFSTSSRCGRGQPGSPQLPDTPPNSLPTSKSGRSPRTFRARSRRARKSLLPRKI